jgi:hypothetical protein
MSETLTALTRTASTASTGLTSIPPNALAPPSPATLDRLHEADRLIRQCPQVEILTEHLLHGGMYARTIRREPGVVAVGSVILRATILIIHGDCSLLTDRGRLDLSGYNVLPGLPGRKSFSLTHGPVEMTMIFPTRAATVEQAEEEIFGEADDLASRKDGNENQVTITGVGG